MILTRSIILRYFFMPEVIPRMRELFVVGFQFIPLFMALVFQAVRLIPAHHPYTLDYNRGAFGIRHVIAAAANNLVIRRENIDQIILFVSILTGVVMITLQILILIVSLIFQPVLANSFSDFFVTQEPSQDIAHMMMDMVFGVPGIFNSCVSTIMPCLDMNGMPILRPGGLDWVFAFPIFPFPIHIGLHQMFQIYSTGLLVVATIITGYFIVTILAETAQTGTAFGKRFNKVWAPIRLVVAFGLLVPISFGLNSAQYIVLHAAKYGSAFATNGWILFNEILHEAYEDETRRMISTPNIPELGGLIQFMNTARTCAWAERMAGGNVTGTKPIKIYLVRPALDKDPVFPKNGGSQDDSWGENISYESLILFANADKQVRVVFGAYDEKEHARYPGKVFPTCGELTFPLEDPLILSNMGIPSGAEIMQRYYWELIKELWFFRSTYFLPGLDYTKYFACSAMDTDACSSDAQKPDASYKRAVQMAIKATMKLALDLAVEAQELAGDFTPSNQLISKGWGAAGIWYNKLAEMNGAVTSAILNVPMPAKYPYVMEYVRLKNKKEQPETSGAERFNPTLNNSEIDRYPQEATAMYNMFEFWQKDFANSPRETITENIFIDTINVLFGTQGLFDLRENTDVHPLAGLTGVGRSLIESSIRNIGYAAVGGAAGVVGNMLHPFIGNIGTVAAGFFVTIAMMALAIGFVLFYVIPFLPFIYYFFAMCGWVKGIFEAMLGAPLWALAHIRIDGEGLPGRAAEAGYYLIFEIFLRPILIVFGLIASITLYAALVDVLNETMTIVTENITGYNMEEASDDPLGIEYYRGPVDQFFYTVVYAIIVYMMGMASFKLIDQIPNKILRWAGQGVQTFGDLKEDPTEKLVSTTQIGAQQAVGSVGGGLNKLISGVGSATR